MKSFAHMTANKLAALLTAAAFVASTPCSAAVLSKAQGLLIGANIVGAEAVANSAVGPAGVGLLARAMSQLGDGINLMVDDLPAFISPAQAAVIKASVVAAQATASSAQNLPGPDGLQTLARAYNQLGNAMKQLTGAAQKAIGQGQMLEINGIVDQNAALFGAGVATGNISTMGTATARLADGLGVMVNDLTT